MSLQLFVWVGQGQVKNNKVHYGSFTLNDQTYHVGDCVYLYPEDEQYPPYIARILAAFVDQDAQAGADPHCIEVKWFERRVLLEPSTKGIEESEREVFELEDTDINPIGCISGKCRIIKAHNYEEALNRCGHVPGWYFCRGYFQQSTNSFVAYSPAEMADEGLDGGPIAIPHGYQTRQLGHQAGQAQVLDQPPRGATAVLHHVVPSAAGLVPAPGLNTPGLALANGTDLTATGVPAADPDEESDDPLVAAPHHRRGAAGAAYAAAQAGAQQQLHNPPPAQQQPASKRQKATGRTCVECGTTTTPQWREGPMGPKTLCNACGVRYVRSQQKAAGQKRSSGGQRNGQGRQQAGGGGRRRAESEGSDLSTGAGSGHQSTGRKAKGVPKRAAD